MSDETTSLDRLHDLASPPAIPWWPVAPGWYVVAGLLLLAALWLAYRWRRRWLANSYRREALQALTLATDASSIAALLRRTALAAASRPEIAGLSWSAWTDWLAAHAAIPMPEEVRQLLQTGIYAPEQTTVKIKTLRTYANRWIRGHRLSPRPEV